MAPGEALPGYLDRLASRLEVPLAELLDHIGLIERVPAGTAAVSGAGLAETKLAHLSIVLGLSRETLRASLLTHYDGIAYSLPRSTAFDAAWRRIIATREWVYVVGSHCCPSCLQRSDPSVASDGIWQLRWKLPWSFMCVEHERLMLDRCPGCGLQPRSGSGFHQRGARRTTVPDPLRCGNSPDPEAPGEYRQPCGHSFVDVETERITRLSPVARAQTVVARALSEEIVWPEPDSLTHEGFFGDLRAVCALTLQAASHDALGKLPTVAVDAFAEYVEHRKRIQSERGVVTARGGAAKSAPRLNVYRSSPRSAALMAAIAPSAVGIVIARDTAERVERLQGVVDAAQQRNANAAFGIRSSYRMSPHLRDGFERCLARRGRLPRRLVRMRQVSMPPNITVDQLPQLFWRELFDQYLDPLFWKTQTSIHARRFCSIAFALRVGAETVPDAVRQLELPLSSVATTYQWICRLRGFGALDEFNTCLERLVPIVAARDLTDLATRRAALQQLTAIDPETWRVTSQAAGFDYGAERNRYYAAAWLWSELAGGDPRLSSAIAAIVKETERRPAQIHGCYHRFEQSDRCAKMAAPLLSIGERLLGSAGVSPAAASSPSRS